MSGCDRRNMCQGFAALDCRAGGRTGGVIVAFRRVRYSLRRAFFRDVKRLPQKAAATKLMKMPMLFWL